MRIGIGKYQFLFKIGICQPDSRRIKNINLLLDREESQRYTLPPMKGKRFIF